MPQERNGRSFINRVHEVMQFIQHKQSELRFHAQNALNTTDIACTLPFLQCELRIQREIRTLWPYILILPDAEETVHLKQMYECKRLDDLGTLIQNKINIRIRHIDYIETKFRKAYPPGSFWESIREEMLANVHREADRVLGGKGNASSA